MKEIWLLKVSVSHPKCRILMFGAFGVKIDNDRQLVIHAKVPFLDIEDKLLKEAPVPNDR